MQTFISRSIPFKEVMKDLAVEMTTDYTEHCKVFSMEIPKKYGAGTIQGINFSEGLGIMIYDCTFYQDTEIQFIINQTHPLKFIFCEKGNFTHRFQHQKEKHKVEELENIIVASDKNRGHILQFSANTPTKVNNLEIDRKTFHEGMACEIEEIESDLKNLLKDIEGKNHFYYKGYYSLQIASIFSQIANLSGDGFQSNLHIHSKIYTIFALQILEYYDSLEEEEEQSILLKRELNLIHEASMMIKSDLVKFCSIQNLSEEVGLNANKLQNGFKEVHGMTVNQFIQEERLNQAGILIKNTDLSFSQIADRVGISSKSYFSKIFKDKYGLTPSEIRKKISTKE